MQSFRDITHEAVSKGGVEIQTKYFNIKCEYAFDSLGTTEVKGYHRSLVS